MLERTFGIFPVDSWAFLAALFEYTGTPNQNVEALSRAAADATFKDRSGQPFVSKDYLALLELLARVDGKEATFNVERVFTSMMSGIERVGFGPVPEWNTVWRSLLSKSLRYKATGTVGQDELN